MKRLIALMLAAAMLLTFAGCASEENVNDTDRPEQTTPADDIDTMPDEEIQSMPEEEDLWLIHRLEVTETLDIGFEVIPETVTPTGATFKFTNTLSETVWFGYNFDVTVVLYGDDHDIRCPEVDIPDGEWTVAPGESFDIELDWQRKYGTLPDGTYRLYMYPNYLTSQICIPMCAEFVIGDGVFDTMNVIMEEPPEILYDVTEEADEAVSEEFRLTGLNMYNDVLNIPFKPVDGSITPTGGSFVIENDTGYGITYDQHFILTVVIADMYYDIAYVDPAPWETPPAYETLPAGESVTVDIDWAWLYGELPDGDYALFKRMQAYDMSSWEWVETHFTVGSGTFPREVYVQGDEICRQSSQEDIQASRQKRPIGSLGDALEKQKISQRDDLYITLDEDSLLPSGALFTLTNKRDENVLYGMNYSIAKKDNGVWRWLVPKAGLTWPAIAMYLEPGQELTEHFYWEDMYGELENGEYMLVRDFAIHHEQVRHDIVCEFTVTNAGEAPKPGTVWHQAAWVSDFEYIYIEDFEMEAVPETVTPTGVKLKITNDRATDVETGVGYSVCKKLGDRLYYLKPIIEDSGITAEALLIPAGTDVDFDIDWQWLYGELPAGDYCILKTFDSEDRPFAVNSEITDTRYQSARAIAEFTIE